MIINKLKKQIDEIQAQIVKIQSECSHPPIALNKVHKSNTGNYDPDCYWTEFHCELCDKFWTEDGSK